MSKDKTTVKKDVLKQIKSENTKMHSSQYFVLLGVLTVVSAVLLTILSAVLARILFDDVDEVRRAGVWGVGPEGRSILIGGFPWGLLALTSITIWGTIRLYKKMEISYKHSVALFYSAIAVSILVLAIIVGNTSIHESIEKHRLINNLTTASKRLEETTARGFLLDYSNDELVILIPNKGELEVEIGDARIIGRPKIGGPVIVVGQWVEDEIEAEIIKYDAPKPLKRNLVK